LKAFIISLTKTALSGNLDTAFETAAEKIHEYPLCNRLLYYVASTLDSALVLSATSPENKARYDEQIMRWYEFAASSSEESIRNSTIFILAGKFMKNSDFDKAGKLIDKLPEKSVDKTTFQAELLLHQGRIDEAAAMLQGMLLQDLGKIQRCLFMLIDIELKDNNSEKAKQIAKIAQNMVYLFGLWQYGAVTPHLQIALYEKDAGQSIQQIKATFDAAYKSWDMDTTPLFLELHKKNSLILKDILFLYSYQNLKVIANMIFFAQTKRLKAYLFIIIKLFKYAHICICLND
jgi:hypothetical protein